MASLADVLTGIEGVLGAVVPDAPVLRKRNPPSPVSKPTSGLNPGELRAGTGTFVLVTGDPDPVDQTGSFETISDTYTVHIYYVSPNPPGSQVTDEDAQVRAVRTDILQRLDVPRIAGVSGALVVGFDHGRPYDETVGDVLKAASVQTIRVRTTVVRGVAP